jgi:acetyl esterase/lipase
MASLQSHVFRALAKIASAKVASLTSLPEIRAFMSATPRRPLLPVGATIRPDRAEGVPVEWIIPGNAAPRRVILYLHGGAWTLGWYNSHRGMVAYLCRAAATRALAVDYRLAPEDPFPAALEDCLAAYRWLLKTGTRASEILIAGDSAGGNLTLTTLMALRDAGEPLPAGAVCISPMTDLEGTGDSFGVNSDPLLSADYALKMARKYYGGLDPRLPLISPHYGDFRGIPRLLVHVGEAEILLSDARRLEASGRKAGVDVSLVVWPEMWHVWHALVPWLPEAEEAVKAIGTFIKGCLADPTLRVEK